MLFLKQLHPTLLNVCLSVVQKGIYTQLFGLHIGMKFSLPFMCLIFFGKPLRYTRCDRPF